MHTSTPSNATGLLPFTEWFRLDEAAAYISNAYPGQSVTSAGLLRAALHHQITLSIYPHFDIAARRLVEIPAADARYAILDRTTHHAAPTVVAADIALDDIDEEIQNELSTTRFMARPSILPATDERVFYPENAVLHLSGKRAWDLPLIGAERRRVDGLLFSIEHPIDDGEEFQPSVPVGVPTAYYEKGFIRDPDTRDLYELALGTTEQNSRRLTVGETVAFNPVFELPGELVIRRSTLSEFCPRLRENRNEEQAINPRAERTYQIIIGALLGYIKGKVPPAGAHPGYKTEAKLVDQLQKYGPIPGLRRRTLAAKFAAAKRALKDALET